MRSAITAHAKYIKKVNVDAIEVAFTGNVQTQAASVYSLLLCFNISKVKLG